MRIGQLSHCEPEKRGATVDPAAPGSTMSQKARRRGTENCGQVREITEAAETTEKLNHGGTEVTEVFGEESVSVSSVAPW